jgi:glycine/D-amino acid oxidase-like deaminating enzyme
MLRIIIIGGGITGAAAAAELVREGHAVTLIEKHGIAAMASGWTLGRCTPVGPRSCRAAAGARRGRHVG